jgi:hypothetical protein
LKDDVGIDGDWLMEHFSIKDGPTIGKVLQELDEWYRDEGIRDKRRYIKKTRELLQKIGRST